MKRIWLRCTAAVGVDAAIIYVDIYVAWREAVWVASVALRAQWSISLGKELDVKFGFTEI